MSLLPFSLSLLRRFWPALVAGALVLALIVQTFRLQATEGALSAEKAGRVADRSSYERAQAEATSKALQAKIATEKKYAENADTAQAGYDALRAHYDSLLRTKAVGSASSRTAPAAQGDGSRVPETAAAVSVPVFALPEADWLKLPALQAYADQCYSFGQGL